MKKTDNTHAHIEERKVCMWKERERERERYGHTERPMKYSHLNSQIADPHCNDDR